MRASEPNQPPRSKVFFFFWAQQTGFPNSGPTGGAIRPAPRALANGPVTRKSPGASIDPFLERGKPAMGILLPAKGRQGPQKEMAKRAFSGRDQHADKNKIHRKGRRSWGAQSGDSKTSRKNEEEQKQKMEGTKIKTEGLFPPSGFLQIPCFHMPPEKFRGGSF